MSFNIEVIKNQKNAQIQIKGIGTHRDRKMNFKADNPFQLKDTCWDLDGNINPVVTVKLQFEFPFDTKPAAFRVFRLSEFRNKLRFRSNCFSEC